MKKKKTATAFIKTLSHIAVGELSGFPLRLHVKSARQVPAHLLWSTGEK